MLAEQPLPQWALGRRIVAVGAQTNRPVDDVALITDEGGWITIQAKKGLNLAEAEDSALAEAIDQLVKIYQEGVPNAAGAAGLRALDRARDRVLILTDASAPQTVANTLVPVTDRLRELPAQVPLTDVPKNKDERRAFGLLTDHLARAWKRAYGTDLTEADLRALAGVLAVFKMDFSDGGPHRQTAETILASLTGDPQDAAQIWRALSGEAQRLADERSYLDRDALVRILENQGFNLRPMARLRTDIARLRELTAANVRELASALTIAAPEGPVALARSIEPALLSAGGNLAVTGVPGAGKTVLLHSLAETSASSGADLVVLRADNLGSTTGQTRHELNTEHDVAEILRGWTGNQPALLLIDGLDQTRGADASAWLPTMARELAATRWRIVATIRTFDLKHGRRWRTMFPGQPVTPTVADPELTGVRHVLVADLTEQELAPLRAHSPRLAALLDDADPRLRRLLANPFNLDIAGQLLAETNADLTTIHSRLDLLDRYWELRVTGDTGGIERNRAVQAAVHEMLGEGRQAARPTELPAAQATPAALDGLQRDGVLRALPRRPGTAGSPLAFAHPVLFDYAVALFELGDPDRPDSFAEILDQDPNLTITVRPSLEYRLATIWRQDGDRNGFWRLALRLTPEAGGHPLAAAAAAQVAAREIEAPADMDALAKACTGQTINPEQRQGTLIAHQLAFLVAAAISRHPQLNAARRALAAFAAGLAATARTEGDTDLALLAAQLGTRTVPTAGSPAAPPGLTQWVATAIDCMTVALTDPTDPRRAQLAKIDGRLLAAIAPHDTAATSETIRRIIAPEHLAAMSVTAVQPLIDQLPAIAATAPELAVDIGACVWEYEETRDAKTAMVDSTLLGLTSTLKQDLDLARYGVGAKFRELIDTDAAAGVNLLLRVVERPEMYHEWNPLSPEGQLPRLRTGASLETSDGHGAFTQMVEALCDRLERLANAQDQAHTGANVHTIEQLVDNLVKELHHAQVWQQLLHSAASSASVALSWALLTAVLSPSVYANSATWISAGYMAARLSSDLTADQHAELEAAILTLVQTAYDSGDARIEQALMQRARTLLSALRADRLGAQAAALIAEAEPPEPLPSLARGKNDPNGITWEWSPDIAMPAPWGELASAIRSTAEQSRSQNAETRTQAHDRLISQWAELQAATANGSPPANTDTQTSQLRMELAERLTTVPSVTPETEIGSQVLELLRAAVPRTPPGAAPAHTAWQSGMSPSWGSTPDTNAVQGLVQLLYRPEWRAARLTDLTSALTPLLDDPDVLYRYLATRALPVLHTEPDALIDELERRLRQEPDQHTANLMLHHLAFFWRSHPHRVDSVLEKLAELPRWTVLTSSPDGDLEMGPDDRDATGVDLLTLLATVHDTPYAARVVAEWFAWPAEHPHRVTRATIRVRDLLNPPDQTGWLAQERAFGLLQSGLGQLAASLAESQQKTGQDEATQERVVTILKIADNLSQQLYFASGAFDQRTQPDTAPRPETVARFAACAIPVLEGLSAIHFPSVTQHIVEVADHIAHHEPKRALLIAEAAVKQDPRYANEPQGLDTTLTLIRHYAADQPDLVLNDPDCTAAIRALLASFVGRGWDKAIDLAGELGEMFN